MKETPEHIDQLFKKTFDGFQETPPDSLKDSVFHQVSLDNARRKSRRAILIFAIFLSICGLSYWAVNSFTGNKTDAALQSKKQTRSLHQRQIIYNATTAPIVQKEHKNVAKIADKTPTAKGNSNSKKANNVTIAEDTRTKNNTISKNHISIKQKITKTKNIEVATSILPEKETPSQIEDISNINKAMVEGVQETDNLLTMQKRAVSCIETDASQCINSIFLKKLRQPLLWSAGFYVGHSLIQSDILHISQTIDDAQSQYSSEMQFPSGTIGINVRAEKRHLFFDFGLQYANFTEKISSNQLKYNPQNLEDIKFLGQNLNIDTSGGYQHYYYMSDTAIRIVDSVWTWNTDSSLVSMYDTIRTKKYDTLRNASWKNTYSFIEIPLSVGWQQSFGRVNLGFSTGPIISMLITTKGSMPYNLVESPTLIATTDEFKKYRFGMSWQISAFTNYQITNRMLLELSPYFRFNVLGIKSSSSESKLKNNSFGLQLGIRYYF